MKLRRKLSQPRVTRVNCLTVRDSETRRFAAADFFQISDKRDVVLAARLCDQFRQQNLSALTQMNCRISSHLSSSQVFLELSAGDVVGAVPMKSPSKAAFDFGLVIHPRFAWQGLGPMLAEMGWNVVPHTLNMPMMKTSERRVPPWVLSSMVLKRIRRLLESMTRRFEMKTVPLSAPRGTVQWTAYATGSVAHGQLLSLPCTFPDLVEDQDLKGAIRFTLERHLGSLGTLRHEGKFIHELLDNCLELLRQVRDVPARIPTSKAVASWSRAAMQSETLVNGIEAIEWTVDERGLAGLSELSGLPWAMPMAEFYESWVETVLRIVARQLTCSLKTGRKRETVRPISWEPAYAGSQKSLIPDLCLERGDLTVMVDAKYKRHWEELRSHSWNEFEKEMQEQHRNDLMQALAYATLSLTSRTITCLAYPCSRATWEDLKERNRLIHRAAIPAGDRSLQLWLAAIPMAVPAADVAATLITALRSYSAE